MKTLTSVSTMVWIWFVLSGWVLESWGSDVSEHNRSELHRLSIWVKVGDNTAFREISTLNYLTSPFRMGDRHAIDERYFFDAKRTKVQLEEVAPERK